MPDVTLVLPYPPTINTYYRHLRTGRLAGRTLISERGRAYRATAVAIVRSSYRREPLTGSLAVDIECMPPDRRTRDIDNVTKSLLDSLTHAGLWIDDSQIDDLRIWRSRKTAGGEVIVIVKSLGSEGG